MPFDLLETMRVEAGGAIPLLERHLARLQRSARDLGFACNLDAVRTRIAGEEKEQPCVFRLLLSPSGAVQIQRRPLPPQDQLRRLFLSPVRAPSRDAMLRHKTTARALYDQARQGLPDDADALLVNERGEATETCIANIAVLRDGKWTTPPVSCGLLPGVLRAKLLDEGAVVEGVVSVAPGETVRCFNAVRGVFDLPFTGILSA